MSLFTGIWKYWGIQDFLEDDFYDYIMDLDSDYERCQDNL